MHIFNKSYALKSDGVTGFIEFQQLEATDLEHGFSLECWLEPAWDLDATSRVSIFSKLGDLLDIVLLPVKAESKTTTHALEIRLGKETFAIEAEIESGLWTHLALVFQPNDALQLQLYINGIPTWHRLLATPPKWKASTFFFGKGPDSNRYFKGLLAQLALWSVPRTPEQIDADMYHFPMKNNAGLLGWWELEPSDSAPATLTNKIGSELDARMNSGMSWDAHPGLPQHPHDSGELQLIRRRMEDHKDQSLQAATEKADREHEEVQREANARIADAHRKAADRYTRKGLEYIYLIEGGKASRIDPESGEMHHIVAEPVRALVIDQGTKPPTLVAANWGQGGGFQALRYPLIGSQAYFSDPQNPFNPEYKDAFQQMAGWNTPKPIENLQPENALVLLKSNYQSQLKLALVSEQVNSKEYSIAAWVMLQTSGSIMSGMVDWELHVQEGKTTWKINNHKEQIEVEFPMNVWVHVAVTYDEEDMRFYLNGLPVHILQGEKQKEFF
ncbi:MAG: LamG domain-containing protein, partial [Bacteroidota bacterium]